MSIQNFLKWSDGSELARTRIIVRLMDRVDELEKKESEREARSGMPEAVKLLERKGGGINQLSQSMEVITKAMQRNKSY